jgi:hypothetical protein
MHFATLKGLVGGFFSEKQMVFAVNWRHCFNCDFDFAKTMSFVIAGVWLRYQAISRQPEQMSIG